jgi:vacuolar protein sorting-associated protein 45
MFPGFARLGQSYPTDTRLQLVHVMLNFAGADQRQDDLFMNENFFSRGKSAMKGLKGVENVYTQHTPHLMQTIELLLRGRLKDTSYPYLEQQAPAGQIRPRPQDVIIFVIGGTTYEEARNVALLNQQFASGQNVFGLATPGSASAGPPLVNTRVILGGTGVLNSKMYVETISQNVIFHKLITLLTGSWTCFVTQLPVFHLPLLPLH